MRRRESDRREERDCCVFHGPMEIVVTTLEWLRRPHKVTWEKCVWVDQNHWTLYVTCARLLPLSLDTLTCTSAYFLGLIKLLLLPDIYLLPHNLHVIIFSLYLFWIGIILVPDSPSENIPCFFIAHVMLGNNNNLCVWDSLEEWYFYFFLANEWYFYLVHRNIYKVIMVFENFNMYFSSIFPFFCSIR